MQLPGDLAVRVSDSRCGRRGGSGSRWRQHDRRDTSAYRDCGNSRGPPLGSQHYAGHERLLGEWRPELVEPCAGRYLGNHD